MSAATPALSMAEIGVLLYTTSPPGPQRFVTPSEWEAFREQWAIEFTAALRLRGFEIVPTATSA